MHKLTKEQISEIKSARKYIKSIQSDIEYRGQKLIKHLNIADETLEQVMWNYLYGQGNLKQFVDYYNMQESLKQKIKKGE
jgi:hypothetical protein